MSGRAPQYFRIVTHSLVRHYSAYHGYASAGTAAAGEINMQHYPGVGAGRRSRKSEPRQHKVTVRLSDAELAAVIAAAGRAELAPAAYIARAGVDAAEHR